MIVNEQLVGQRIKFIYNGCEISGIISEVNESQSSICVSGIWYYTGNIKLIMDNALDRMQPGQSIILG